MEHDLGSEFATMKERAMDQIIQDMGISETYNNDSMLLQTDSEAPVSLRMQGGVVLCEQVAGGTSSHSHLVQ